MTKLPKSEVIPKVEAIHGAGCHRQRVIDWLRKEHGAMWISETRFHFIVFRTDEEYSRYIEEHL